MTTPSSALTGLRDIIAGLTDANNVSIFGTADNVYITSEPIETRPVRGEFDCAIRFDGWRPHGGHSDRFVVADINVEVSVVIEPNDMGVVQVIGGHGIAGLLDVAARIQTATAHIRPNRGAITAHIRCLGCSEIRNVSRRKASCTLRYEAHIPLYE